MEPSAFDELLSSQGFSSTRSASNATLGEMKRKEDIKELDPDTIKVLDNIYSVRCTDRIITILLNSHLRSAIG